MQTEQMRVLIGDSNIRELQRDLGSKAWPEFMQQDQTVITHWASLYTRFADFQYAVFEDEVLLGVGNSLPVHWHQALIELPDRGLDWAMEKANEDFSRNLDPNILVGVQILINPEYQGQGLSYKMLDIMKDIARKNGFTDIALPVRPTLKSEYPLIPMDDYMHWVNDQKLPFDPWIRVHIKAGGKIINTCHRSMNIAGTISEWEAWTNKKFHSSGDYIINKALNPVHIDRQKNLGQYMEPNVWIVHPIN